MLHALNNNFHCVRVAYYQSTTDDFTFPKKGFGQLTSWSDWPYTLDEKQSEYTSSIMSF